MSGIKIPCYYYYYYTSLNRQKAFCNTALQHMRLSQDLKAENEICCILQGIMFEISYTTTLFILTYISLDRLLALYQSVFKAFHLVLNFLKFIIHEKYPQLCEMKYLLDHSDYLRNSLLIEWVLSTIGFKIFSCVSTSLQGFF